MKVLIKALRLLMQLIRSVANAIVGFFGLACDRIAEHAFALIVYLALSIIAVLLFAIIPLYPFKIVAVGAVCIMTSILTTIRFRYGDVSERKVSELRRDMTDMEKKLRTAELHAAGLEERLKREKQSFYGMDWVWEIAVAEASCEFRKTFDYYVPKEARMQFRGTGGLINPGKVTSEHPAAYSSHLRQPCR